MVVYVFAAPLLDAAVHQENAAIRAGGSVIWFSNSQRGPVSLKGEAAEAGAAALFSQGLGVCAKGLREFGPNSSVML